jgi:hypothetical protein
MSIYLRKTVTSDGNRNLVVACPLSALSFAFVATKGSHASSLLPRNCKVIFCASHSLNPRPLEFGSQKTPSQGRGSPTDYHPKADPILQILTQFSVRLKGSRLPLRMRKS